MQFVTMSGKMVFDKKTSKFRREAVVETVKRQINNNK